jgi:hypothetical protein
MRVRIATPLLTAAAAGVGSIMQTFEVGQSTARVRATLGNPERILKFENKSIYCYKDFKVIFIDGRLSDVQ